MKPLFSLFNTISILLFIQTIFSQSNNTNYGTGAGNSGNRNSCFGYEAGDLVTGNDNTPIGTFSGKVLTSGNYNNIVGSYSGYYLTTGSYNTFNGYRVGVLQTTGAHNTFIGAKSGTSNISGNSNTFIGSHAGYACMSSANNVFLGSYTGYNNENNNNVFLGYKSGYNNEEGEGNVFLGYKSGYNELGSNKLYIANSEENTLLSGDFSSKFVGIGITNPVERFQIGNIWTFHDGGTKIIGRNFKYDGMSRRIESGIATAISFDAYGAIIFSVAPSGDANSEINWTDALLINNAGYLGVGIANPEEQLHVKGGIINGGQDFIIGKNDARYKGADSSNRALVHGGWTNTDELIINYDGDFEGGIRIMGPHTIFVGNVTIGDFEEPPNYKLSVDGTIMAEEIQVQLSENWDWPDYVFEKDYNLMSLYELEKYVKTNHGLPNVPSESDIQINGNNLGEMDAILLRKIEELTLYIIEQNKRITKLEEDIKKSKY